MTESWLAALATGPWALPMLAALVLGDAFLVVVPGEVAVTAFGALAVAEGEPALAAVIAVAAAAAATGDVACYTIGRAIGLHRWRWMRARRTRAAFGWASSRLHARAGSALFTARFIPFARLAVNLVAGASRMPVRRYLPLAAGAALVWAVYQAVIGAVVAALIPGSTVLAVAVSIVVALAVGTAVDVIAARARRTGTRRPEGGRGTRAPRRNPSEPWMP